MSVQPDTVIPGKRHQTVERTAVNSWHWIFKICDIKLREKKKHLYSMVAFTLPNRKETYLLWWEFWKAMTTEMVIESVGIHPPNEWGSRLTSVDHMVARLGPAEPLLRGPHTSSLPLSVVQGICEPVFTSHYGSGTMFQWWLRFSRLRMYWAPNWWLCYWKMFTLWL